MNKWLRLPAWCEVLTGVFMIVHVAITVFSSKGKGGVSLGTLVLIALGTLGLFAGTALFRSSMLAWRSSVVLQVLLIPVFFIGTFVFRPGVGVFVPLGMKMPEMGNASALFEFTFGIDFKVALDAVRGQHYVAVNLAALVCLAILLFNRPVLRHRALPARPALADR